MNKESINVLYIFEKNQLLYDLINQTSDSFDDVCFFEAYNYLEACSIVTTSNISIIILDGNICKEVPNQPSIPITLTLLASNHHLPTLILFNDPTKPSTTYLNGYLVDFLFNCNSKYIFYSKIKFLYSLHNCIKNFERKISSSNFILDNTNQLLIKTDLEYNTIYMNKPAISYFRTDHIKNFNLHTYMQQFTVDNKSINIKSDFKSIKFKIFNYANCTIRKEKYNNEYLFFITIPKLQEHITN